VYGVLLVLMVLFLPRGLVPTVTAWWERRTAGSAAEPTEPAPRDLADTPSSCPRRDRRTARGEVDYFLPVFRTGRSRRDGHCGGRGTVAPGLPDHRDAGAGRLRDRLSRTAARRRA